MAGSAFIVISASEKLNWIVDDIGRCRPQNPSVVSHIGTGKIEKKENGIYYVHNDHTEQVQKEEGHDLQDLIANQFAHFRHDAELKDNLLVFILDNPIDEESFVYSSEIYQTIDSAIKSKSENDCNVIRVLFSYDVSHPCDVCEQVPEKVLQWHINEIKNNPNSEILYIDNQDRYSAALATDKEEHDLMLPRMLCDFMMLMSAQGTQYNLRNAAHSDEKVFSLGYAECMYYYPDIRAYYDIAYQYNIRKLLILNGVNSSTELDYNTAPLGISERIERLRPIYGDVPFDTDINQYPKSNDKQIDDIICQHKTQIIAIKQTALEEAKAKDDAAKTKKREQAEQAGKENIEDIIVTTEQDRVNREYPDYIDRQQIYTLWLQTSQPNEKFEDNSACTNAQKQYLRLIDFVQSLTYKSSLTTTPPISNPERNNGAADNTLSQDERSGCNLFARLFRKRQSEPQTPDMADTSTQGSNTTSSSTTVLLQIKQISQLLAEKQQFRKLCDFEQKTQQECKDYKQQMDNFRLTVHCKSVDNLIDLQQLRDYESGTAAKRMQEVEQNWLKRDEKIHTLSGLYEENKKTYETDMLSYEYIHWDKPFPFTKDIDVEEVCKALQDKATPLVNALIVRSHQEQNTTYLYYTDHSSWEKSVKNKEIDLPYGAAIEYSTHIASKLALFHILKWDENIIKGLTDINELNEQPSLNTPDNGSDLSDVNSNDSIEDVPYEEIEN